MGLIILILIKDYGRNYRKIHYHYRYDNYKFNSYLCREEVDIAEYNEWKRKQEEEEKRLAEQYGMPYGEEVNDAKK